MYGKRLVLQVLMKLFSYGPFEGQELKLGEWYLGSPPFNSRLAKATGWYCPSSDSWRSMAPNPSFEASVSSRNGFLKSAKTNTGAVIHLNFNSSNAFKASGGSSTSSALSLLASPSRRSLRGLAI